MKDEKVQVFNANFREYLKDIPNDYFDLTIADPPYGLGQKLIQGGTWSSKWKKEDAEWDVLPTQEDLGEILRVSKNYIIWGANYISHMLPPSRCFIAWQKPYMEGMSSMSNVELAYTSFDRNAKWIPFNKESIKRINVTQKPIALYKWLLKNYANKEDKIFDPYLGSGSSAIAAKALGFDFTGCEIREEQYLSFVERYKEKFSEPLFQ
jgi:site-specific DNA-methyltransferase (adenine-specific)